MLRKICAIETKALCAVLTLLCVLSCFACCDGGQGDTAVSTAESSEKSSATESRAPESSAPESRVPESSVPESSALESRVPESSAPESSAPESRAPESRVPESRAPESRAPESRASESSAPESNAPESSVPESRAPESNAPESRAPESRAPESRVPESRAPESSAPESRAPESSAPESRAPNPERNPFTPPVPLPEELFYDEADDYFDNSLFLGYSVMMHFGRYVAKWREELDSRILGDAVFCADVGVTFRINASQTPQTPKNALPKYRGKAYNFEDLPAAVGCKTLYIGMTGYSDLKVGDTPETSAEQAADLSIGEIEKILEKNPDLNVVILPTTYNTGRNMTDAWGDSRFDNGNIRKYNDIILGYCNRRGLDFVDIATPMTDGNGLFIYKYSSDGAFHIREHAYYIWMEVLRDYARKKQVGIWKNYDRMPPLTVKKAD